MKYSECAKYVFSEQDLLDFKEKIEKDIEQRQQELEKFIDRGYEHINKVKEYENNNNYRILGHTYRDGRQKRILLIIKYPDGTSQDVQYIFNKVSDMRTKLQELKEKYSGDDWSKFEENI